MFEENENLVLEDEIIEEDTENVEEQTTEETVDGETEEVPEKRYTEEELNQKLDELLAKKIARKEAKIRKELEKEYQPYKELGTVVNAGLGVNDVNEAASNLREFYTEKGIEIPKPQPNYSENDLKVLANSEANDIIESGFDEVVEEVDRLAKIGVENMSLREKIVFTKLAEYRQEEGSKKELAKIGVSSEVVDSKEFKDFASQFNQNTPISKVYELYSKTSVEKAKPEKLGSMKNGNSKEEKTFYSPDDVDKLTEKELDDPKIYEAVRKSMLTW